MDIEFYIYRSMDFSSPFKVDRSFIGVGDLVEEDQIEQQIHYTNYTDPELHNINYTLTKCLLCGHLKSNKKLIIINNLK